MRLLSRVNKELGVTIVLVTHEMDVVRTIADRVAVIGDGHIVEQGSAFDVFSRPQSETAKAFVAPFTVLLIGTYIGTTAAVVPLSIAVMFGFSRIVEQNLVTIQPGVIEAARAAGASPWRIIATLLIPEALGPLILGFTFVFVAVVDMTAIAGAVGGGGLGSFALQYGYGRWDYLTLWVAVGLLIAIAWAGQLLGNLLARRVLRR